MAARGVVDATFKPAGNCGLHRTGDRCRFHCVRCRQDKMASLVATIGSDWTQTVCERCYGFLVHEQRENAKKAPSTERRPAQAKQPPPHVNPGRPPKGKLSQPRKKKKRQQLEEESAAPASVAGARQLAPHSSPAANVHAELWQGRCVQINGRKTEPLTHHRPRHLSGAGSSMRWC